MTLSLTICMTSLILTQGDFLPVLQFERGNSIENSISAESFCPGAVTFKANIFNTN